MKIKLAITVILTLVGVSSVYAKTDITGDIYGQVFSLMNVNDITFPYGVTIDDLNQPTENCDNDAQTCLLDGLSWSDIIGWTYWDGVGLQTDLGPGAFPDEFMAKAAYNGNLSGYIWGEKFGWVSLSACSALSGQPACVAKTYCSWSGVHCEASNTTRVPDVTSQDISDWGAYVDFCPLKLTQSECENAVSDQYCNWDAGDSVCVFDAISNPNGQPFGGYAWSEYLGWIKFGPESGEISDFTGAFTNWFPDLTPPVFSPPDPLPVTAWIPNESSTGTITWKEFVDENDSYVDIEGLKKSTITVDTIDNGAGEDFAGCPEPLPGQPNGNVTISLGATGEANLSIPNIGRIGTPLYGFCKYELGGAIYNASGFGYYFGPAGLAIAASDGVDTTDASTAAPNTFDPAPVTLLVRAGDPVTSSIPLFSSGNDDAVADGNSTVGISIAPTDNYIGNVIVSVQADIDGNYSPPVDSSQWVRKVALLFDLDASQYTFDSIDWTRDFVLDNPIPIKIENKTFSNTDPLQYPLSGPDYLNPTAGKYYMDLIGYAPSTTVGNSLILNGVRIITNDVALPAVSPSQGPWPANSTPFIGPLNFTYNFKPTLEVTGGTLDSDFLALSQSAEATFDFTNNSSDPLGEYSFDNILSFTDGGSGSELLEVKDINLVTLSDVTGRTDPNEVATRYGLLVSTLNNAGDNQFHSTVANYHAPIYPFENNADNNGVYEISGDAYVAPGDPCLGPPSTCPPIDIDRSDLLATGSLPFAASETFSFHFTPSRYLGGSSSSQITFDIRQYLSYHSHNNPFSQYALYPATPYIQGIQVKSLGIDTSGTVSGGQIYNSGGDRDLKMISTTSSADLRREIRKNVAVLTRNVTTSPACQAPIILNELPTSGNCVIADDTNKTYVAYYSGSGNPADTITLGNGSDVVIPNGYKYTLILNAADLSIKENIIYPPSSSSDTSFGIIVIQDSDGKGGNVYLDPSPTNIVGLLYAEGSLLSRSASNKFYYGGGGNAGDLKNQLFWQGSIASRNTIGGASALVIPKGTDGQPADCSPWNDIIASCSQAYDLDFVRRFTTVNESGTEYSPAGYLFSGGGSCSASPVITCSLGPLPTTVSLNVSNTIDVPNSKSLDTFFIERDNRPVPPGFSSGGGLTSSQVIR